MNGKILKKIYDITFEMYQKDNYLRHDEIGDNVYFWFNGAEYLDVYINNKDEKIFGLSFTGIGKNLDVEKKDLFETKIIDNEIIIKEKYTDKELEEYYYKIKKQVDKF